MSLRDKEAPSTQLPCAPAPLAIAVRRSLALPPLTISLAAPEVLSQEAARP